MPLGSADEFTGRNRRLAVLTAQPHEHLESRAFHAVDLRVHDGLEVQLELIVAQRALNFLQPVNLTAVPRRCFLARGVHVNVDAALFLGDVAR